MCRKKRFIRVKEFKCVFLKCVFSDEDMDFLYEIEWYHGELVSSSLIEIRGEDFFI